MHYEPVVLLHYLLRGLIPTTTMYFSNKPGFMDEIDEQLMGEISPTLPASRQYVAILIDEMKVKEGLVFNKHSGAIIGYTNLGNINDQLLQIEKDGEQPVLAKHVLVVMVRGIMFNSTFPMHILELEMLQVKCHFPLFGKQFVV